jgi:hypothetical protein
MWAVLMLVVVANAAAAEDVDVDDAPRPVVDHARLIAAMPDAVESVLLMRVDQLRREPFPLAEMANELIASKLHPPADENGNVPVVSIQEFLLREALRAEPIVFMGAGSEFIPATAGNLVTEFNDRAIWLTSTPLTELHRQLIEGECVKEELTSAEARGYPVFSAEVEQSNGGGRDDASYTVHVALVDQQMLLISRCKDEISVMIDRLAVIGDADAEVAEGGELPTRWLDAAADLDVQESPIVLFREYSPETSDTFSPAHPLIRQQIGITAPRSLVLVMSDIETMTWTARLAGAKLVAEEERPAITLDDVSNLLGSFGQTIEALDDDDGLRGRLRPVEGDLDQRARALTLIGLLYYAFGAPFYI